MATTPDWIRKAAIASVVEALLRDPEEYLAREFGVQPRTQHVLDVADRLYAIATDTNG